MSLPFNPGEGLIVVPTRLYGPAGDAIVRLALDTGATGTVVNWDLLVLIGYDPAAVPERVQMTTGSGVEFVPRLMMDKIEALGKRGPASPCCAIRCLPVRRSMACLAWTSAVDVSSR